MNRLARKAPLLARVAVLAATICFASRGIAQEAGAHLGFAPADLSVDEAIGMALRDSPELATFRSQRGIAAANLVIARTYPYNPILTVQPAYVHGPHGESITNPVDTQATINLTVEIRHQGRYRTDEALAALSRTEWEILAQETAAAIRVARAYWGLQYRTEKLRLLETTAQLNQQTADQVRRLVDQGRLRPADWILARTEVDDTKSQYHMARIAVSVAQGELARSVGMTELTLAVRGKLEAPGDRRRSRHARRGSRSCAAPTCRPGIRPSGRRRPA